MVDLEKMKAKMEERREERSGRARAAASTRESSRDLVKAHELKWQAREIEAKAVEQVKAMRRALRDALALVFFFGNHSIECPWHDGDDCRCYISRRIKKIKRELAAAKISIAKLPPLSSARKKRAT